MKSNAFLSFLHDTCCKGSICEVDVSIYIYILYFYAVSRVPAMKKLNIHSDYKFQ